MLPNFRKRHTLRGNMDGTTPWWTASCARDVRFQWLRSQNLLSVTGQFINQHSFLWWKCRGLSCAWFAIEECFQELVECPFITRVAGGFFHSQRDTSIFMEMFPLGIDRIKENSKYLVILVLFPPSEVSRRSLECSTMQEGSIA